MDYLNEIYNKLEVAPTAQEARRLLENTFTLCADWGILYTDNEGKALALANHILQLKKRLEAGEDFPEIDGSIAEQVPLDYRDKAAQLLEALFPEYSIPLSENVLVAIHLSVATLNK